MNKRGWHEDSVVRSTHCGEKTRGGFVNWYGIKDPSPLLPFDIELTDVKPAGEAKLGQLTSNEDRWHVAAEICVYDVLTDGS